MHSKVKKNVGIATFLYTNYGALLQAMRFSVIKQTTDLNVTNINFRTQWHEKDAEYFQSIWKL